MKKKHMLASVTGDLFQMIIVIDTTVVVRIGEIQERLWRGRVMKAPSTADLLRREVLQHEQEEDQNESAANDTRTKENKMLSDKEYFCSKILDHSNKEKRWMFMVEWYGFSSFDDTWKPIEILPRSSMRGTYG